MNPIRTAIGRQLRADDPLVACARYDCHADPETHYDHRTGRMPNHEHQPPSVARIAGRAAYRWATGRRRLREDLAATRTRLDEMTSLVKRPQPTLDADPRWHAAIDSAAQQTHCGQCGQPYFEPACGPTHAAVSHAQQGTERTETP